MTGTVRRVALPHDRFHPLRVVHEGDPLPAHERKPAFLLARERVRLYR